MRCGPVWSRCCRAGSRVVAVSGVTIARWSRRSSGGSGRCLRGGICRRDSLRGRRVLWRFDRWAKDGALDQVLTELQGHAHARGELEWVVSVDSTIARAHQHAAGAPRTLGGGPANYTVRWPEPADHALGRLGARISGWTGILQFSEWGRQGAY